jgi:putative phage-type endonuclease
MGKTWCGAQEGGITMIQGSDEWFAARLGRVTASRITDVMATVKNGEAATRLAYKIQLAAERLTGTKTESFTNDSMRWGTETEPQARIMYEARTGSLVSEVGMVEHPAIGMTGASPDGLVGDDGLLEIKCPNTATHIDTLYRCVVPTKYLNQMQWQMACTGRSWCDFVSYDPRLGDGLDFYCERVFRDEVRIAEIEAGVVLFLSEVDEMVLSLQKLKIERNEK